MIKSYLKKCARNAQAKYGLRREYLYSLHPGGISIFVSVAKWRRNYCVGTNGRIYYYQSLPGLGEIPEKVAQEIRMAESGLTSNKVVQMRHG